MQSLMRLVYGPKFCAISAQLISFAVLSTKEVEAVLINGRVKSIDTIIKDTDRVAFVTKFINSPNRNLPGLKYMKTKKG